MDDVLLLQKVDDLNLCQIISRRWMDDMPQKESFSNHII